MKRYRAEPNADLTFSFPQGLAWEELDRQGIKIPHKMSLVDLVIDRDEDTLLVEIKDPSNVKAPVEELRRFVQRMTSGTLIKEELTPKARCSYLFLHLMKRDAKPIRYMVLLGLDALGPALEKAALIGFKDRLLTDIREENEEPWRRHHIADCAVFSLETWNKEFAGWPVVRDSKAASRRLVAT